MPTTPTDRKRPTTARKVTPRTEKSRKQALDEGFRIKLKGEVHEVRIGDVTSKIVAEMRQECGTTPMALFMQMKAGFLELDEVATFVWLACRLRGETVALDQIEVTYDDMFQDGFFADLEDEGEPDPQT